MLPDYSKRQEIGLDDLLRAIKLLQPKSGDELSKFTQMHLPQIAQSLGFSLTVAETPKDKGSLSVRGAYNRERDGRTPAIPKAPQSTAGAGMPPAQIAPDLPEQILSIELEQSEIVATPAQAIPGTIRNRQALRQGANPPLPRKSLIAKDKARGLLVPAVARAVAGKEPDLARIIDACVHCRMLKSLPTQKRYTTRNGCQLLLDFSDQLSLWRQDMRDIKQQFHDVLGRESCAVFEFEGDPNAAVRWTGEAEQSFEPSPGVPVVAATDLGLLKVRTMNYRPGLAVWRQFARDCAKRQIPVIVLIPLSKDQWPADLSRQMKLIHWHPETHAASVQWLLREIR